MTSSFAAYLPCAEAEKVIAEKGYDPLRDPANPPDSVFCSHGAGTVIPWDQVEQYTILNYHVLPVNMDGFKMGSSRKRPVLTTPWESVGSR